MNRRCLTRNVVLKLESRRKSHSRILLVIASVIVEIKTEFANFVKRSVFHGK